MLLGVLTMLVPGKPPERGLMTPLDAAEAAQSPTCSSAKVRALHQGECAVAAARPITWWGQGNIQDLAVWGHSYGRSVKRRGCMRMVKNAIV